MIPFLLAAIMFSWFGLQQRKWQQGAKGMSTETLPANSARQDNSSMA